MWLPWEKRYLINFYIQGHPSCHNTVLPSINFNNNGRKPNIHGKHFSISFPRILSSCLRYEGCIYSLLWCDIIYSLYAGHITISVLELDFFPIEIYLRESEMMAILNSCDVSFLNWVNFAAHITCGTDRVGARCRRLGDFLTHGSFKTPLLDMLAL